MKKYKTNNWNINNKNMKNNQNDLNNQYKFILDNELNNHTNNYNNESFKEKNNILEDKDKLINGKKISYHIPPKMIDNFMKNNQQKEDKNLNQKLSSKSKKKDNINEKKNKVDNNMINNNFQIYNQIDSNKFVNNKIIDLNDDKSIFNAKIIKIFIYIFYYENYVSKNKYNSFYGNEKYYLINPDWTNNFKKYFNCEEIYKSLLYINQRNKNNITYNNLDNHFKDVYNEILYKNVNFKEKELPNDLKDRKAINCKLRREKNIDIPFISNGLIFPSTIIELIIDLHKEFEKYLQSKDLFFLNKNIIYINMNQKKIIIGNLKDKNLFIPNDIFVFDSYFFFEKEKEKIKSSNTFIIDEYIKNTIPINNNNNFRICKDEKNEEIYKLIIISSNKRQIKQKPEKTDVNNNENINKINNSRKNIKVTKGNNRINSTLNCNSINQSKEKKKLMNKKILKLENNLNEKNKELKNKNYKDENTTIIDVIIPEKNAEILKKEKGIIDKNLLLNKNKTEISQKDKELNKLLKGEKIYNNELIKRENEIKRKSELLKEKETDISIREENNKKVNEDLNKRELDIKIKEKEIQTKLDLLTKKEKEMDCNKSQEENIEKQIKLLNNKKEEIEKNIKILNNKEDELKYKMKVLNIKEEEIKNKLQVLFVKEKELKKREIELENKNKLLNNRQFAILNKDQIEEEKKILNQQKLEISKKEKEIQTKNKELIKRALINDNREKEIKMKIEEIKKKEEEILIRENDFNKKMIYLEDKENYIQKENIELETKKRNLMNYELSLQQKEKELDIKIQNHNKNNRIISYNSNGNNMNNYNQNYQNKNMINNNIFNNNINQNNNRALGININKNNLQKLNPPSSKPSKLQPIKTFKGIPPLIGLNNIGSTCFKNSVLQCLSQTEDLTNYFLRETSLNKIMNNNIAKKNKNAPQLCPVYYELIRKLWDKKGGNSFSPNKFMTLVDEMSKSDVLRFKTGEAGDAKDFIIFILEQFHKELQRSLKNSNQKNIPLNQYDKINTFNHFIEDFKENTSIISDIFFGINETNTICLNCKNNYNSKGIKEPICYNYGIFNCLIFPLEEVKKMKMQSMQNNFMIFNINTVSIMDCFLYNQKGEYFTGQNRNYCNLCKQLSDAVYTNKIFSSPKYLILIMNRGKNNVFNIKLDFVEYLDLTQFVIQKDNQMFYSLYGVITHLGESGPNAHFVASCKSPVNNKWYRFNDSIITPINNFFTEIHNFGTPYILFYKKTEKNNNNRN